MASLTAKEAELLQLSDVVPVNYAVHGEYSEPFFDYDDEGNPQAFGFEEEPPDPTVAEILAAGDVLHSMYNVAPSQFAETAIRIPMAGKVSDFSFVGREYLRRVYDTAAKRVLLKCGRQVEKSTTLGNRLLCYSALISNYRSLFVAPSAEQAKVFSNDRIKDVIASSPLLKAYITQSGLNQAVFFKKLINFSQIILRYAYLTADRVRGIPADFICIDEIQDILIDNIPVIEQCAFHATHPDAKIFLYSGTPKSLDNTLEKYWSEFSTQNEWVVPCRAHGTPKDKSTWHWNVLDEDNIGTKGLVCDRCHRAISACDPDAMWASLQPMTPHNKERVTFEGYRIPQIMVPWVDWQEVLEAQEQYSRAQFYNEKLGMSYDTGVRPITQAQVKDCARPEIRLSDIEHHKNLGQSNEIFCGIDWGTGENSYTVITFGGYIGSETFTILWTHRFTGQDLDPDRQLDLISQMITQMNAKIIGVDYGGGFYTNNALIRRFGPNKVMKYQYNPRQKKKVYWEPNLNRWMVHRTEVMTVLFEALKKKQVALPNWDEFNDPYGQDLLNIFSEYNNQLRQIEYKKAPGKTDDTFHSILYCILASMIARPRPDLMSPGKETGGGMG